MPYSLNGAQVQAVGGRWRRHSPLVSHPSRSSSRTALALWRGVLSSTTTTGFLGLPRRAPPLYNLASSKRSGLESAGANIRNLKGVFAEWESDTERTQVSCYGLSLLYYPYTLSTQACIGL